MRNGVLKSDWFTGLIITFIFLILSLSFNFIASIERNAYDFGVKSSSRIASDKIAIIAIDDASITSIGRWPWSRDIHAQMHDILADGDVKVIGQTVFFPEPQLDPGLKFIRELKTFFASSNIAAVPDLTEELALTIKNNRKLLKNKRDAKGRTVLKKISDALENSPLRNQVAKELETFVDYLNSAETTLDSDSRLAQSMQVAGNIVLLMPVKPGQPNGKPDEPLPEYVAKNRLAEANIINAEATNPGGLRPLTVIKAHPSIAILGEQASAFGASVPLPDVDGAIRAEPLIIDYYDELYPSMSLMLAAAGLNLGIEDIHVSVGSSVQLDRLNIKTDAKSLMNIFFYHTEEYNGAFPIDSFFDVYSGKIPAEKYKDKIVLIGPTALGVTPTFVTPIDATMSSVVTLAHSVSSILNEDFFVEPEWGFYARLGAITLAALYIMFLLPKLSAIIGFITTTVLLVALLYAHYYMMTEHGMWLKLMMPALLLATGHILLTTKHFFLSEKGKKRLDIESAESNRMLGLSLQGQGQLDMAFEKFRKVVLDKSTLELLYNLALDYERKRQFNKAKSVYDYMAEFDSKFRDIKSRSKRASSLEENLILGGTNSASSGGRLILEDGGIK
jgi:serine/threonine-protein kinase